MHAHIRLWSHLLTPFYIKNCSGAVLAYRKMSNGGRKDGSEQKVEESTFELSNIGGDGGMTSLSNVKMDDDMDLPSGVV
jgi:hypothetical protein